MVVDDDTLRRMWLDGDNATDIGNVLGCSERKVIDRAAELRLPRRFRGWDKGDNWAQVVAKHHAAHKAAVRMPESPPRENPELMAAIARAKDNITALGQVAARFRLPYAMVLGLSQRGGA
jgi:hypothetical protein